MEITYFKTEWLKTLQRFINAKEIEFKEQYILVTDINWVKQAIKNFNNLIVVKK
jgi:hypothetical protein